jgi:hypothetical protein
MCYISAYIRKLSASRIVLWCYFIWYAVMVAFYFDPAPGIWITSLGISALIGVALILNAATSRNRAKPDRWQLFRLFLIPFCVSSFSTLVKGHGFFLIFSPNLAETGLALALCAIFFIIVSSFRHFSQLSPEPGSNQDCTPPD